MSSIWKWSRQNSFSWYLASEIIIPILWHSPSCKILHSGIAKINPKISLLYSATWLLWAIAISIVIVIYFAGNQHIVHERTSGIDCQAMGDDKDIMPDSHYNLSNDRNRWTKK